MRFLLILWMLLVVSQLDAKKHDLIRGRLVSITQSAQVYTKPNVKSRVFADVEEGMLFMLLRTAYRGKWLMVEDEDGNRGWLLRNATDLDQIFADPVRQFVSKKNKTGQLPLVKKKQKPGLNPLSLRHEFALMVRDSYSGLASDYSWGLRYYFFLPHNKPVPQKPIFLRKGLEVVYQNVILDGDNNGANLGLRLKVLSRNVNNWLTWGADVGAHYQMRDLPDDEFWSMGAGLHLGYFPLQGGITSMLRIGGEFFHEDRLSLELSVGYAF